MSCQEKVLKFIIMASNIRTLPPKRNRIYDHQGFGKAARFSKDRKKKNLKNWVKLFFLGVLVLFAVFCITQIPGYVNKIRKPFKNIPGGFSNYSSLNNNYRTNILLVSFNHQKLNELAIASLSPIDPKARIITLDTKVLGDLLIFENSSNFPTTLDILKSRTIKLLNYPIDSYVALNTDINWINQTSIEKLTDYAYSFSFFANILKNKDFLEYNLRTNLTINQIFALVNQVKALKPERFDFIKLAQIKDNSGNLDFQQIKNKLGVLLSDSKISDEGATAQIINASGVEGVGTLVKDIITNLGGNVIQVTSSDLQVEKSEVLAKDKKSFLGLRLSKILNQNLKNLTKDKNNIDIKVIIGKDFGKNFDF